MIRTLFAALVTLMGLASALVYASAFIVHQNEQALVLRTLLIWQVNTDYRYNVQPAQNYVQWLSQPYIDDVYDITHDRPKAQAEGINFFETAGRAEDSPSARRWQKAQAERNAS